MNHPHEFRSALADAHYGRQPQPWDQPIFYSTNFVAIPSLGSLVEGWLLVVPRKYALCVGALEDGLFDELQDFTDHVSGHLQSVYGPVTLFEHGPSHRHSQVGCGVDYAHLHLVPLPTSCSLIDGALALAPHLEWTRTLGLRDTRRYYDRGCPYLYLEQPVGTRPVIASSSRIPSQLFRKVIAANLGRPDEYDWKLYPEHEQIAAGLERLGASGAERTPMNAA